MSEYTDRAENNMKKTISALESNFGRVRTGRANARVLDNIRVDYYGVPTPITQMAAVKVPQANMLVVEPWDKTSLKAIERAIMDSDLGITPSNDGISIRLPFPQPTEERRKELVKECRKFAEESRVAIRNIRREVNAKIDKDEEYSEDDVRREQGKIQKLTDSYVSKIDEMLKVKEAEVMEI